MGDMVPATPPGPPPLSEAPLSPTPDGTNFDEKIFHESDNDVFYEDDFVEDPEMELGALRELFLLGHAQPHVAEIFSPSRVTSHARKYSLLPGFALDLTNNDPFDNQPWDFRDPVKRRRAKDRVIKEKPQVITGCPPCTPCSI